MATFASYPDQPHASSSSATGPSAGPTTSGPNASASANAGGAADDGSKKKKPAKRRKVNHACLYCRRSHMTCDEGRPCQRCIKREIGHLCHDERRPKVADKQPAGAVGGAIDMARSFAPVPVYQPPQPPPSAWPLGVPQGQFLYQPETLGNEFSVLTDFLETLDDGSFFSPPPQPAALMSPPAYPAPGMNGNGNGVNGNGNGVNGHHSGMIQQQQEQDRQDQQMQQHQQQQHNQQHQQQQHAQQQQQQQQQHTFTDALAHAMDAPPPPARPHPHPLAPTHPHPLAPAQSPRPAVIAAATKTEQFLLTAADQESGSRNERLNRVIRSKYEAGLLKPYNYVKGYARLSRWMDRNVSQDSKQQILQPLSVLRPKFRAVAQSLRDLDLVFIEEAFERLLLDYDRVFSAMGVPACLWRRTGEIYKGNREFSELVGVDGYMMRDGRLCIYELMAEESAVNYWEKYGHVAFDSSQKAVLTSCVLRYKPHLQGDAAAPTRGGSVAPGALTTLNTNANANTNSNTGGGGIGSVGPGGTGGGEDEAGENEEGFVNCCFSFTIRRDKWGIPTMIVGNFIRC